MAPDSAQRKLRVLIVDDSPAVRESLARLLNEIENVEVVGQAQDGVDVITVIHQLKPEVVILDLRMPGRSGIDVLGDIRKEADAPKVVVFTNYPFRQYRTKCLEAGASFFFDKSTEFDQIPQALEKLRPTAIRPDPPGAEASTSLRPSKTQGGFG